jgi:hypothetical protein
MNIGRHKVKIKKMLEGWYEMSDVMHISKVTLKDPAVVSYGNRTLAKLGRSAWDKRRRCPGFKRGKSGLEIRRPLSIGERGSVPPY